MLSSLSSEALSFIDKNGVMNLTHMDPETVMKLVEDGVITSLSPYEIKTIEKMSLKDHLSGKSIPLSKELVEELGDELSHYINEKGEIVLSKLSPA